MIFSFFCVYSKDNSGQRWPLGQKVTILGNGKNSIIPTFWNENIYFYDPWSNLRFEVQDSRVWILNLACREALEPLKLGPQILKFELLLVRNLPWVLKQIFLSKKLDIIEFFSVTQILRPPLTSIIFWVHIKKSWIGKTIFP